MKQQTKAYLFGLAAVSFWSTIASAGKLSLRYLTPVELLFFSSTVSCAVLFVILIFQKKLPELKKTGLKELRVSLMFGLLNPFLYYLVLFKAYDLLPAQQAQAINYTWAITLSLLSIPILRQKVKGVQWVSIAFSYFGVLVIATKGNVISLHFDNPIGVGLALLSTVIWSLYWIYNTRDTRDPVVGLFLNFATVLPFIVMYTLWIDKGNVLRITPGLTGAAYIGVFEMGVTFVLWLSALKMTESSAKVANLIFISPFLSLFFIHFLVGEKIFGSTLVGLAFVICGLSIQAFSESKKKGSAALVKDQG
ncbi:DMT family transporter [Desulfomarina sp.]